MASFVYNYAKAAFTCPLTTPSAVSQLNWTSAGANDWKVMLVTSSYTANPDDEFVSSANAAELTGTGYQNGFSGTGRQALGSRAISVNLSADRAELSAANVSWAGINAGTIKAAIVYRHVTSDADSPLVAYIDLTSVATNGGAITIQWASAGIINLT